MKCARCEEVLPKLGAVSFGDNLWYCQECGVIQEACKTGDWRDYNRKYRDNFDGSGCDPYTVTIGGIRADPYRIARAYGITDPIIFQALKKLLRSGRKHKSLSEDVAEAITSLQRWQEMEKEDKQ